jgi:hypothetical protein
MKQQAIVLSPRFALYAALIMTFAVTPAVGSELHELDYEIISKVISHGVNADPAPIVIDEATTGLSVNIFDPSRNIDEVAKELETTVTALREWSRNNRRIYILRKRLTMKSDYRLLTKTERSQIFSDEDPAVNWHQFRARFPETTGIIRVSRPGIDDTARTAVLYLEYECGAECGSGRLVNLLQSDTGQWRVTTGTLIWITAPQ